MNRPVNIFVLAFRGEKKETVFETLEEQVKENTDLVLLPEMWLGDDYPVQTKGSSLLKEIGDFAAKHSCYVVCPLGYSEKEDGSQRLNSALVYDRKGELVYRYDKIFPWWNEFDFVPPITVGNSAGVFDADFGRVGIAICFDVNFSCIWEEMARQGAELVLWPSDYSAGRSLQAHAINYHYYIVTATRALDSALIDLSGDETAYHKSEGVTAAHYTIDLDREIFHENFNMDKIEKLTKEVPGVKVEKHFTREQWLILSGDETSSVKELAKAYEMETLRDYLFRSQKEINDTFCCGKGRK